MGYAKLSQRLEHGGIVILDGGTGTELERRGVSMDPEAWCGPVTLENGDILESIHRDYIAAGADIITANTYASSRLMLGPAGYADRFEEINRKAISLAHSARDASGRSDVLVAGALSHMCPHVVGTDLSDLGREPSRTEMADAFGELTALMRDEGCDLILLEMMYYPQRTPLAFEAALATGLPVWAGFSARYGESGEVVSYAPEKALRFEELVAVLEEFAVDVAGIMHSPANVIEDALSILRRHFAGPLMAYPDSGYFEMPNWHFEDVIPPQELLKFATQWVDSGVQIIGGCCGLSPEHIAAISALRDRRPHGH